MLLAANDAGPEIRVEKGMAKWPTVSRDLSEYQGQARGACRPKRRNSTTQYRNNTRASRTWTWPLVLIIFEGHWGNVKGPEAMASGTWGYLKPWWCILILESGIYITPLYLLHSISILRVDVEPGKFSCMVFDSLMKTSCAVFWEAWSESLTLLLTHIHMYFS